jgi:hypothetical protein
LRNLLRHVNDRTRKQMLNSSGVLISICENPGRCPICQGQWHVQKTTPHHGKTIGHGQFEIRETIHVCANRCRLDSGKLVTRRANSLAKHIIPGKTVGYDVMTFVGLQRFVHHRQREEIRELVLHEHGIPLSSGTISNLTKLFLGYLLKLHDKHIEQLRDALNSDGGWPLHIDATCEDGRGTLLVALAGWRRWVLGSWKIPTEHTQAILPCLHEIVKKFGAPCAIMRDLGRAITLAVNTLLAELELDIPVLACHMHFLKDIGKDLLTPAYGELRALFKQYKTLAKLRALSRELGRKIGNNSSQAREHVKVWQSRASADHSVPQGVAGIATVRSIAQWVIDYKADSTGHDYPFDRPYLDLYDRCMTACRAVDAFIYKTPSDPKVLKTLKRLRRIIAPVASEMPFEQIARRLRSRSKLFDELRDTLRLVPKSSSGRTKRRVSETITSDQTAGELWDIRQQVGNLTDSLKKRRPKRGPAKDTRMAIDLILRHIKDHSDYLWGHVISISKETGKQIRIVDRTNNIIESFFRCMKHDERRRSGRKILTQDFENLPPEAALAYNLTCPDYVSIVCGSLEYLHEAFAKIDLDRTKTTIGSNHRGKCESIPILPRVETASLSSVDRELIRTEQMQQWIVAAAKSRAPYCTI